MFTERFAQGLYLISNAVEPREVLEAWIFMDNEDGTRAIVSLENYHRSAYPAGIKKLIDNADSHFIPYFASEKLYFIENELLAEIITNQSADTKFELDYSIMLDTNYASYIDNFVRNTNWSGMNNEVFQTIDLLIRGNFHYDYLFYMIENYKNSFKLDDLEDAVSKKDKRAKFYRNLVSMELFKSIDSKNYIEKGKLSYLINEDEALISADQIFNGLFNSSKIDEMMDTFQQIHKAMVLLIIGTLQIKFGSKTTVPRRVERLFEFANNVLGIYYEREFIVAHMFFLDSKNVNMLNKVNKGMNSEKLLRQIENIAWDFSVPRIMEYWLKLGGKGRFFIPFFLTNDYNLRQLLSLFKVKGLIFNKTGGLIVPFPSFNSNEYFKKHNCDIEKHFTDEVKAQRKTTYRKNCEDNFSVISEEFDKLVCILKT
ncbi:hypothetical protein [Paenibacillus endoradicis]|uniref:hypothetical protein n=1 Tax=Paenibacillus endoradicis TaxID=2972487 RepID=UPI0021598A6F|nr:hypothetical protein [Paenibacillus endoradicis]MCR8655829.1 hypothetical protein [Paenibacillus endoradicis]MCR8658155.1 hypothetical protein [Paenibacillus endoradicis]